MVGRVNNVEVNGLNKSSVSTNKVVRGTHCSNSSQCYMSSAASTATHQLFIPYLLYTNNHCYVVIYHALLTLYMYIYDLDMILYYRVKNN